MLKKALFALLLCFCLVSGLTVSNAFATYGKTLTYGDFYAGTSVLAMDDNRTMGDFVITLYDIEWNASATGTIAFLFQNKSADPDCGFEIDLAKTDLVCSVWTLGDGAGKIGQGTYAVNSTITLSIGSDSVTADIDGEEVVENYYWDGVIGFFQATRSYEHGPLVAGYVTVEVGGGGAFDMGEWLPTIVSFVMLGAVMGLVKKIGGR